MANALELEGERDAAALIGRWSPNDLAYIERLEFGSQDAQGARLKLVTLFQRRGVGGWPDFGAPMYQVTLAFEGVRGLSLKDFGGTRVQVMGFDIRPTTRATWEDVSFELEDYEEQRIRFNCRAIKILDARVKDVPPDGS